MTPLPNHTAVRSITASVVRAVLRRGLPGCSLHSALASAYVLHYHGCYKGSQYALALLRPLASDMLYYHDRDKYSELLFETKV